MIICQDCGGYKLEQGEVQCACDRKVANGNTFHPLVGLLRRIHDEIDGLDEGIPMSANTWDEMEDVLQANKH